VCEFPLACCLLEKRFNLPRRAQDKLKTSVRKFGEETPVLRIAQ
jgi:hypothetical protein